MPISWKNMAVRGFELDWYRADHPTDDLELHMTWAEDEWVLTEKDAGDVLLHTGTTDAEAAQLMSEVWRVNATVNSQPLLI